MVPVSHKKFPAAFGGGRLTSDGRVMPSLAERRLGVAKHASSLSIVAMGTPDDQSIAVKQPD